MSSQAALSLKIAESAPFFTKNLDLSITQKVGDKAHSLHYGVATQNRVDPDLVSYFINSYSQTGDLVLDPFAAKGEVALEALLRGRRVFASDQDKLGVLVTSAKMFPADITEVTLALPMIDLKRPVELGSYLQYFAPFYDVATYRELVNLRKYLKEHTGSRVARFIEMIALGLLHGQTAGFFSVYTSPVVSISPKEQLALNAQRSQEPDYRAVIPRILRKAAMILRDGIPTCMMKASNESSVIISDTRYLVDLRANSVDLVVTTVPLPEQQNNSQQLWLRSWFANIPAEGGIPYFSNCDTINHWLDYMNELLLELARVTKGGKRAVLNLNEVRYKNCPTSLDDLLIKMVTKQLNRYWEAEGIVNIKQLKPTLKNCLKPRENTKGDIANIAIVLRRR